MKSFDNAKPKYRFEPDKNPEEGNPRMRRGAELTANELDNTDITQVCKQILQGNIYS